MTATINIDKAELETMIRLYILRNNSVALISNVEFQIEFDRHTDATEFTGIKATVQLRG